MFEKQADPVERKFNSIADAISGLGNCGLAFPSSEMEFGIPINSRNGDDDHVDKDAPD
jgi:hypothetical protein